MHPALRKGTLFYQKNTPYFLQKAPPIFHFLTKKTTSPFHFLRTGLRIAHFALP